MVHPDQTFDAPAARLQRSRRLLHAAVLIAATAFAIELLAWLMMPEQIKLLRSALMTPEQPETPFARVAGVPYLLYAPSPGYANEHGEQHNKSGWRGLFVPVLRTPGVSRVLCLGGSTTYGDGVARADATYPANLRRMLERARPDHISGIEVINGGLPYGSSAEILTSYHFKYHYYRPDLVIINTGGNDADASWGETYQPDYSHWRKPLAAFPTVPRLTREFLHSHAFSALTLPLFYGLQPRRLPIQREPPIPPVHWYDLPHAICPCDISSEFLAFRHNLSTLIHSILRDGANVVLVPFRPRPGSGRVYGPKLMRAFEFTESVVRQTAADFDLLMAPFPASVISKGNWADRTCHVNARGAAEKAAHIVSYARRALWGDPDA
jgi:hypothetical protein